jgi:DNA-binding transcriptional LysR family regulator
VGSPRLKSEIWENQNPNILESLPMIFREEGSATRYIMEEFIQEKKLQVKMKIELTSNEAVKQAIIAGLGYSIMPIIGIKNELVLNQLEIIPVIGFPIISAWKLIWPKGKKIGPVMSAYLKFIDLEKEEIVENHFRYES